MPATDDGTSDITALPSYTLTVNAKAENPVAAKAFVEFAGEPASPWRLTRPDLHGPTDPERRVRAAGGAG